jgi:plasmid stabilization system protein ParE
VKIEIVGQARRQIERASSWWEENRPSAPLLLEQELEAVFRRLASSRGMGIPYPTERRPHLRRVLLPQTAYHVYFSIEREETVIVVHSLWGARRGRGPKL